MLKITPAFAVIGLTLLAGHAHARGDMYPDSFVAAHVGSDSAELEGGGYSSGRLSGNGSGISARFATTGGILIGAAYEKDTIALDPVDLTRDQLNVDIGYLGTVGEKSNWFIAGQYTQVKFGVESSSACNGSCVSDTRNGIGVKAGFIWPFAEKWFGTLDFSYSILRETDISNAAAQGILNGSIGYKFNPNVSLALGIQSNAWVDTTDADYTTSLASYRAILGFHF